MKHSTKIHISKYLIAAASLLPVAKPAAAKGKTAQELPSIGEYCLSFGVGLEHLLPSRIINSQIKSTDLEGFNPGFFAEMGVSKWTGQHGKTNYEHYIGFFGRFDYYNFHSRAYNINDIRNVNYMCGEPYLYVDPSNIGCAHIQDLMGTLNFETGFGWYGVLVGVNAGLGFHFDNHGNFGPVAVLGCGLGYRFNENVRLDAKWRLNMFPFENLNSKTHLSTTPGLRNSAEIGVIYKLHSFRKGMEQKKNTRGKHR